ncbi:MAG: hypothetical protein AAB546_03840 [Patescibacteria group bacterium]
MHAFLIVGPTTEKTDKEIVNLLHINKASRFDFVLQKIAEVRDLKKFTKTNLAQKTAIVIQNFNEASEDAQNALLKSLEEPQQNVIYILLSGSLGGILPTIVSRCELIELNGNENNLSEKDQTQASGFLGSSTGQRLVIITKIKDRGQAIEFLNNLLIVGHKQLLSGGLETNTLQEINQCLLTIKANGNIQLQLTNMVVKLNK